MIATPRFDTPPTDMPVAIAPERRPLPQVVRALPLGLAISGGMWLAGLAIFLVEWFRL